MVKTEMGEFWRDVGGVGIIFSPFLLVMLDWLCYPCRDEEKAKKGEGGLAHSICQIAF
jgi:hypothetical protein